MAYLYETHLHTCQASACGRSTGAEHARYYRAIGFDGIMVTDHFFRGNTAIPRDLPWVERIRRFALGYEDAKAEGDRIGLKVFFGYEENVQGDEYLVYGISPEWMAAHPEMEHWTRREQLLAVHAAGGCVVQAHPFRERDYIERILLARDYVDAVEVCNAGNHALENRCAHHYARACGFAETAGSDNHWSREGLLEAGLIAGIATEEPLQTIGDWVSLLLNHGRFSLMEVPGRPDTGRPEACTEVFMLDGQERPVRSAVDWRMG